MTFPNAEELRAASGRVLAWLDSLERSAGAATLSSIVCAEQSIDAKDLRDLAEACERGDCVGRSVVEGLGVPGTASLDAEPPVLELTVKA